MKQWLNPLSVNPRLFGAGSIRKALRTIHRTAVRGIRVSTNSSHTLTASETLALDSTDYVGAFLFHGNNFDKYLFDGGYVTYSGSTPSLHFYLHDHQGNNRAVAEFATLSHVNASLSQTTYYYPYGGVFGDLGSYPESQPYKYNGKEFDRMHGLDWYDYGARQYDPAIARFTSMDPLAEKYYHISPYAYCAGNPVNYVDPDGRDIWNLDSKGYLLSKEICTLQDVVNVNTAFFKFDMDGNEVKTSLELPYGSIVEMSLKTNAESTTKDIVSVAGDNHGTELFEFLSKATDVEWSLERTGLQDSGMNYLETTHSVESLTFQNILDNNEIPKVRQLIHSHPNGHNYPSEKDLDAQKRVNERLQNDNITYLIYTPLNNGGSYYGY